MRIPRRFLGGLPAKGRPSLGRVLLVMGLSLVWPRAAASEVALPIRIGPTELHYGWLRAGSGTAGYYVRVSRSGLPFVLEQTVARPEAWIPVEPGDVVRVEVVPFNAYGRPGESYPIPAPVLVFGAADDADGDGLDNGSDPCPIHPSHPSVEQDGDGDGVPDACDSCPGAWNPRASDIDGDGVGDACDDDIDGDGLSNPEDLCPRLPIPEASDWDSDGLGNACDPCTTLAWTDPPTNPPDQNTRTSGIDFKNLRTPGAQGLRLTGEFSPVWVSTPIDPSATGLSFQVEDADGPIYSLGIPPGAQGSSACHPSDGWDLSFSMGNAVWRYVNASGSLDPLGCSPAAATLVSVILRDKRFTKGWVEYVIEFEHLELDHVPSIPAQSVVANVTLGDRASLFEASPFAASGSCSETFLVAPASSGSKKPFCKAAFFAGELNKIVCRGP